MNNHEEILTPEQLAERFSVNKRTILRWVGEGCPVLRPSEKILRFRLADVIAWAENIQD